MGRGKGLSPAERAEASRGGEGGTFGGKYGNATEAAAGAEQLQGSPVAVESSSLGIGFPIVLLLVAAAVAALAFARRRDSTQARG